MWDEVADDELVRRIAGGEAESRTAEAAFCRRFGPRARLYGLRHLRDEQRAMDLMQSVLLAVLEAIRAGRVEDPTRVDRFLLGTCRNVALRMREVAARAEPVPDEWLRGIAGEIAGDIERVDRSALLRCLSALDDRSRSVLVMAFLEDRRAEEIGRHLDTTAGNVRVVRHRALSSMRRCLDGGAEARS
jgi:RNA polymerase sigma-70 factor (ECF subfamily)